MENLTALRGRVSATAKPITFVESRKNFFHLDLRAVWEYRELLYFLVWRDIKVRYKQTAIGAAWAIFQPLLTMLILTVIFSKLANIASDGVPYPIFAYSALLPWNYFSQAITRSGASLVSDANLIRKVYFPRLIIPTAGAIAPVVDFAFSALVMIGLMVWYHIRPTWGVVTLPVFFCLAVLSALAVSLWLSALNVRYRDVGHTIPFLVQVWMYASPIAYPPGLIPKAWRSLYNLNPMVGVVEGFRWALLGKGNPDFWAMVVSAVVVLMVLFGGLVLFKRMERTFADVV